MDPDQTLHTPTRSKKARISILIFFIFCLIITFIAWGITKKVVMNEYDLRFNQDAEDIKGWVEERFASYTGFLHGLQGFVEVDQDITAAEWSAYVKRSKILDLYPGVSTVTFVQRVKAPEVAQFVSKIKKDTSASPSGYPDFTIHPEVQKPEYYVIKFIEPLTGRESALGLDITFEEERAKTVREARDSGNIVASEVVLSTVTGKPVFSLLAPIYKKGFYPQTSEERQEAILGIVYLGFRGNDVFKAIFGPNNPFPDIDFELYSSTGPSPDLLYDHDPSIRISQAPKSRLYKETPIQVNGDRWKLVVSGKPSYKLIKSQEYLPKAVLLGGLIFSFLTFLYFLNCLKRKRKQQS